jgi:hypothetical protein
MFNYIMKVGKIVLSRTYCLDSNICEKYFTEFSVSKIKLRTKF